MDLNVNKLQNIVLYVKCNLWGGGGKHRKCSNADGQRATCLHGLIKQAFSWGHSCCLNTHTHTYTHAHTHTHSSDWSYCNDHCDKNRDAPEVFLYLVLIQCSSLVIGLWCVQACWDHLGSVAVVCNCVCYCHCMDPTGLTHTHTQGSWLPWCDQLPFVIQSKSMFDPLYLLYFMSARPLSFNHGWVFWCCCGVDPLYALL